MLKNRRLLGISDTLFKKIFADKDDKSLLTDYVNAICNLNLDPNNVEFLPIEIKETENERGIRLDVRFQEVNGTKHTHANLEAQTTMPNERTFDNRKFLYAASLFKDAFSAGDNYDKEAYSRTIFFILRDPNLKGSPIKKTVMYEEYDKKSYDQIEIYEIYIENLMSLAFEELDNYAKMVVEITSVLVENNPEKYKNSSNPIVRKVVEKMIRMTEEEGKRISEELRRQYFQEMDELNQSYVKQGFAKATLEHVQKLHQKGFEAKQIADLLDLSLEEVEDLLK